MRTNVFRRGGGSVASLVKSLSPALLLAGLLGVLLFAPWSGRECYSQPPAQPPEATTTELDRIEKELENLVAVYPKKITPLRQSNGLRVARKLDDDKNKSHAVVFNVIVQLKESDALAAYKTYLEKKREASKCEEVEIGRARKALFVKYDIDSLPVHEPEKTRGALVACYYTAPSPLGGWYEVSVDFMLWRVVTDDTAAKIEKELLAACAKEAEHYLAKALDVIEGPAAEKLRVLLVGDATGPESQLLRTHLAKRGAQVSVLAQKPAGTVATVKTEQLITRFPTLDLSGKVLTPSEKPYNLKEYDVVVGIDPDWTDVTQKQADDLRTWVEVHGGGLIYVAGPTNTPQLARGETNARVGQILKVLPVVPDEATKLAPESKTPRRLYLHPLPDSDLLKIDGDEAKAANKPFDPVGGWERFFTDKEQYARNADIKAELSPRRGFLSYYPVKAVNSGARVLAEFAEVNARGEQVLRPWLVTTDPADARRCIFVGSGEAHRLFAHDHAYHERYWTKLMRFAAAKRTHAPTTMPDDGYWDWRVRFGDLNQHYQGRMEEILRELGHQAADRREKRRKFAHSLRLDQAAHPIDPTDGGDFWEQVAAWWQRGNNRGESIPVRSTASKAILDHMKANRDKLKAEIAAIRPKQEALVAEGLQLAKAVYESAAQQAEKSQKLKAPRNLKDVVTYYADQQAIAKLSLYDAAEWYAPTELEAVIEEFRLGDSDVKEWSEFLKAKAALARAEHADEKLATLLAMPNPPGPNSPTEQAATKARVEAMAALREVIKLNPNHAGAAATLKQLELSYVAVLAAKLDREQKMTVGAFKQYLTNRGYNPDGPRRTPGQPEPLVDVTWEGVSEVGGVLWGQAISTIGAGLKWPWNDGRVIDVIEGDNSATGDEIVQYRVTLVLVRNLIRAGVPLSKIQHITRQELEDYLRLKTASGKPLGPKKVEGLWRDLKQTFARLGDLQALAEGKPDAFVKFLGENYFALLDPAKSYAESVGDFFFSPGSLAMWFGGSAMVRGGKDFWYMSRAEISLLEGAGDIDRVAKVFARGMRLESFGGALAKSDTGKWVLRKFAEDLEFFERIRGGADWKEKVLNFLTRAANGTFRVAAAVTLYGAAAHATSDVPGLRQLVDLLAALGPFEMTYDILARKGITLKQLESHLAQMENLLRQGEAELAGVRESLDRMNALHRTLSGPGRPALTPTDAGRLDGIAEQLGKKRTTLDMPGKNPLADLQAATAEAAAALKKGDLVEATRALKAAGEIAGKVDAVAAEFKANLKLAREVVVAGEPGVSSITPEPDPALVANRTPTPFVPDKFYPAGEHGELLQFGDQALAAGDLDRATKLYRDALEVKRWHNLPDPEKAVESRLTLAVLAQEARVALELQKAQKLALGVNASLTGRHVEDLIAAPLAAGKVEFVQFYGGANPIFAVRDVAANKNLFVFKFAKNKPEEVASEVLATEVLLELGVKVPGCRDARFTHKLKFLDPVSKKVIETENLVGVVYRHLEGKELEKLTEAQLLALAPELAKQRALRLWLGDADGHFRNIMLAPDGAAWMLDFGKAHFGRGSQHPLWHMEEVLGKARGTPLSPKEMMRAVLDFPRYIFKRSDPELYGWMDRMDGVLSYRQMESTVKEIKAFCSERDGARLMDALKRSGLPESQIKEAFEVLRERAELLEEVLKAKFPPPPKPTSLPPRPPEPGLGRVVFDLGFILAG